MTIIDKPDREITPEDPKREIPTLPRKPNGRAVTSEMVAELLEAED